jgi:hypothetical protein
MSYGSDPYNASEPPPGIQTYARQRVQAPAIALIVVGILNLLLMVFQVGRTVLIAIASPQELIQERDETLKVLEEAGLLPKEFLATYKQQQQGRSPEDFKRQVLLISGASCALGLLIAFLPLLGGICMLSLRAYALCLAGAISAAIPCLSCGGCCCFGEIVGIWALIVLLSTEVRAAFQ